MTKVFLPYHLRNDIQVISFEQFFKILSRSKSIKGWVFFFFSVLTRVILTLKLVDIDLKVYIAFMPWSLLDLSR